MDYPEGKPCWAPGAADYLEEILSRMENWHALEWGGGRSSVWLQPKVSTLNVIEHDAKWVKWICERTDPKTVKVWDRPFDAASYVGLADTVFPRPNLWLIDGMCRIDCIALVERKALRGDIVVLDDALDYAEHLIEGDWVIDRFEMPHPHAGIPINHAKYGHLRNTNRKEHSETKETWVCRV